MEMESAVQSESVSKPKKLGPTATAITAALESNQSLQSELKRRLVEVRRLQLQNRLHAAQVTRSLSLCWDSESYQRSPEGLSALDVGDAICGGGRSQNLHQTSIQRCTTPRMDSNPSRKWKRHFFVGADGSTPDITVGESSASTEAKVEAATTRLGLEFENSNEEKRPLAWSKEDVITLQRVAHEAIERLDTRKHDSSISKDTNKSQTTIPWDDNSYFEEVAANLGTNHPRSAEECRLALLTFADVNIVTAKFTKEESLFILREVAQAEGGDVDWYELTCKLNLQFYKEPQRRTTWQCFKQYQSSLRDSTNKCPPWTADEDELLLKYIAAHGPQFVFAESAVSQACQNLFPLRDPKSVKYRAQSTLVNPNFVNDRWDVTEQRKLALLMRAYSDQHNTTPNSDHFPHRSQIRVVSKWERSLNPAMQFTPFSAAEDERLLAAVKELGSDEGSFVSIEKQFPNRTGGTLWYRWTQLADEKDVVSKLNNRLIKRKFGGTNKLLLNNGDGMLATSDFVVQKKRHNKNC